MNITDMHSTSEAIDPVVVTYYELLEAGSALDPQRLRAVFADDLDYEGPGVGHRVGGDAFAEGAARFARVARKLNFLDLVGAAGTTAALYDAELPGGTMRFAEFFRVADGRITGLRLLYDATEFRSKTQG